MARYLRKIRWRIYAEGGGGSVRVFEHSPDCTHATERQILFDSLDDPSLPRDIAEAIRKDGRHKGELDIP